MLQSLLYLTVFEFHIPPLLITFYFVMRSLIDDLYSLGCRWGFISCWIWVRKKASSWNSKLKCGHYYRSCRMLSCNIPHPLQDSFLVKSSSVAAGACSGQLLYHCCIGGPCVVVALDGPCVVAWGSWWRCCGIILVKPSWSLPGHTQPL